MPFFMIALGALGIIGGGVCLSWGLPYLVLEQGFTYAIIGSVLITGGVILIALGLMLREFRAMAGRIGGFSAQDAAVAIAAGSVAAGSAVAAGVVAGQSPAEGPDLSQTDDAQGELPLDAAPEPALAEVTVPDVAVPGTPEAMAEPAPSADAVSPAENPSASAPTLPKVQSFPSFEALPAPTRGEDGLRLPAPEHMRSMPQAPADDEDPFERLRRSLVLGEKPVRADALAAGMTTGVVPGTPAMTMTPPDGDMPGEHAPDEESVRDSATPEPEDHAEAVFAESAATITPEIDGPEARQPEPEAPPASPGPAISQEGIVSVRRIGDSTYTMYADGSVRAETPDTVLHFATVAELKAHLTNPMR